MEDLKKYEKLCRLNSQAFVSLRTAIPKKTIADVKLYWHKTCARHCKIKQNVYSSQRFKK